VERPAGILGEDAGHESEGRGIGDLDRLFGAVHGNQVEDRPEDLVVAGDVSIEGHPGEQRRREVGAVGFPGPGRDLRPLAPGVGDLARHLLGRSGVNERSDRGVRVGRRAVPLRLNCVDQLRGQLVVKGAMHDQALARRAGLAVHHQPSPRDLGGDQVEVGIVEDQAAVVAAELKVEEPEGVGGGLRHRDACRGRAGE